jgi:predicted permease
MHSLSLESRQALRSLARSPGLAAVAVLALTLGIGLTTTMFSIVNGVVLQGLPFEESERLLHIERARLAEGQPSLEVPIHDFLDWREQQKSFEGLAAFDSGTVYLAGSEDRPVRYDGAFVTANTFGLLRVRPQLGRDFTDGDDLPSAPTVAILSHRVWQDRYRGDSGVLGRPIRLNGEAATIVGVMPEGFAFPMTEQIWSPLRLDPLKQKRGEGRTLEVIGRLRPDLTPAHAASEFAGLAKRLEQAYPDANRGVTTVIQPYISEFIGQDAIGLLYTMLGAVFGVLLIACANVANLLLARASLRIREVAIRSALGAGRLRVIAQQLVESAALAMVGGALGIAVAHMGARWFNRALAAGPGVPFWFDIRVNPRVAFFVLALSALAGLLAGIIPAVQASRTDVNAILKDESRGTGLRIGRFSRGLVIAEITLSCGLLVGAALMVKSVVKLNSFQLEYLTKEVFTARVGLFEADYPDAGARRRFYRDLRERLSGRPGVEAVALTTSLPVWGTERSRFEIEGVAYASPEQRPRAGVVRVSPGYLAAFGLPLRAGRDILTTDASDALPVALVSQSFAARYLAGDAVGQRFRAEAEDGGVSPWRTVVGVVSDATQLGLDNPEPAIWYEPIDQSDAAFASIAVRTAGPPLSLTSLVRDEVAALDPNLPIYFVYTMQQAVERQTWFYGVFGTLFILFGAAALFLAVIGLYAVMAFSVSRRTQEIGIRMAVGAAAHDVLRLILRQSLAMLGIGLGLGLALAAGFARLLKVVLFRVEPWDPAVFGAIVLLLVTTALAATLLPARRAARLDPVKALHHQ